MKSSSAQTDKSMFVCAFKTERGAHVNLSNISPKISCKSIFFMDPHACRHYQDELSVIGQFPGPSCFGPVSFLQRLLTDDLTVCFPLGKTLQGFMRKKKKRTASA